MFQITQRSETLSPQRYPEWRRPRRAPAAAIFPDARAAGRLKRSTRDCLRLCTRDPVVRLEPSGDAFAGPDMDDLVREIGVALGADGGLG